jgi:outer membrane protein assembly complex protein YaeT
LLLFRKFVFLCCFFASTLAGALELRDIAPADQVKIKNTFPKLWTTPPTQAELDNVIRFLMKEGSYEIVSFEKRWSGEYIIVGRPLRTIEEIRITGAATISQAKILETLELKVGDRFDRKKAMAAGEKLKNFYGESGYFNTIINLSFPKAGNENVILQFEIKENAPCRLERLTIDTSNPVLKRRLSAYLDRYLNRPLTENLIDTLTKRTNAYFVDNRYLTAELTGPDVRYNEDKSAAYVKFEIKDPYRWEFFFEGNQFDSQLDIFRALDWSNRDRKNVEPASEGAERIKRNYLSKGFPQVAVEFEVEVDQDQYLKNVFYDIQENNRVKIKNLIVQGRISRTPKYYSDLISDNSSDLISRGYYNRQDLDEGFKNLTTQLRNEGFLKARIQSSRVEYDATKKNATVFILIDEGPLTLVQTVDFEGNRFFSSFELVGVLGLNSNSPLRLTELESGIEKLKLFYHNQGFLEMKILNEGEDIVHYSETGSLARLLFKIYEGPRVRIASVRVEGNSFTKTWVILKEGQFKIGQVLTPDDVDSATQRLNRMGLFSRVDIHTLEENTSVAERTLVISITERDPGVFRFGAGVNSERQLTAKGFTSLAYNNLGGTARAISGRFQLSQNVAKINYPETSINVGYLEPFLANSLTRGRVSLTRSEHVFDYSNSANLTSITTSNVINFNLERDFNKHYRGIWKLWGFEERKDFERNGHCIAVGTNPALFCSPDLQYVATIGPTLEIDFRDNAYAPSRGTFTKFVTEYSDPKFGSSGGINFLRSELHESYYLPLLKTSKRWVWANQGGVGYLTNISNDLGSGVPAIHSFFLGGVDTVRGFDYAQDNERIPPGNEMPVKEGNQILVKSDSHYYLLKTELRFPIYGEHGGVLFYDGGAVYVSGYDFSRPYRDSVGIGYRYMTPVGPVSLDIAFKINPRMGMYREAPFRVHFSIGSF